MRKLFTLLTVALASTSMWAQFDNSPELKPATSVAVDGKTEYIMAVKNSEGTEFYYGKGNNWGTRTSAKEDIAEALTVRFVANPQTIDSVAYETIKLNNYVSDKGGWNAMADCDGGLSAWVDGQGRTGDGSWLLTDLGGGKIELANLNAPGGKFGVSWTVQNWSAEDGDYVDGTSDEAYFDNRCYFIGAAVSKSYIIDEESGDTLEVKDSRIYGEDYSTTWQLYDASTYNARLKMFTWFWDEGGCDLYDTYESVKAAVDAAQAIYDNENATVDQLEEAYKSIMSAIGLIKVEENRDLLEGATAETPISLAEMGILQNADFETSDYEGWDVVLTGNNNQVQSASYSNNGVSIKNFLESWTWSSQLSGEGHITQEVGLPEGLYILGVDMIATRQSGSKDTSEGVELFAESSNGQSFSIPVATANNAPEHFELPFTAKDGTFTIGVRYANTTCNWIAADNFSLVYYGATEKPLAQINLGKVIEEIAGKHDGYAEIVAKNSAINTYDATYEAALAMYDNGGVSDDEYTAMGDSLKNVYNALVSSINDYKYFAQCIQTVRDRVDEFTESNPDLAAEIADYLGTLEEAYAAQEWEREQMEEILPTVSEIMGKYTNVQPGDDVTFYLNNAAFEKNFSGWQITGTSPWWAANHGQGENNNADLCQETPAEDDGLAECYHAVFSMYQTIKNVPAGLYTLSVQGFNRHDDGNTQSAVLFAKFSNGDEQTVDFADIDEYATEEKLYDNGQWSADAERNGLYAPNGMTGSAWHFVNKKDGENYDYTNKFSILMKEAGDLTVGVRCDNSHQWVIFDNFRLVYEGSGANVWVTTIEEEITKLDNRCAEAGITSGQQKVIDELVDEANAFVKNIEGASEEDCQAMLAKLQAQYEAIKENVSLQTEIQNYYDALYAVYDLAQEADAALLARYDAICAIVETDYDELNNDELKAAIEEAKNVINLVKMPKGWENASDENPVDFSKLIVNRHFNSNGEETDTPYDEEPEATANYTFTAWQGKQPGTGGGTPGNCGEVWNSSAFDAYQELSGLPAGTYELSCQGFLRHGGGTADSYSILNGEKAQEVYAYLYGTSSEGSYSVELHNIAEVQLTQEDCDSLGIDISGGNSTFGDVYKGSDQLKTADQFFKAGYYKNSVIVKVGADGALRVGFKKIGAVSQDWVVVDNYSLVYYGGASTVQPSDDDATAIANVETPAQKAIYTITGMRVNKMAKPGLYIINGVKVLVK